MVLRGNRVEEFDFESAHRKQLRGNIYLAKVTRVEPSLQAAFVDYGGNRHGFLAFSEIHPDYYQIPVADRQALIDEDQRAQRAADDEIDRRSRRHRGHPRHSASHRHDKVVRSELAEAPDGDSVAVEQVSAPHETAEPIDETAARLAEQRDLSAAAAGAADEATVSPEPPSAAETAQPLPSEAAPGNAEPGEPYPSTAEATAEAMSESMSESCPNPSPTCQRRGLLRLTRLRSRTRRTRLSTPPAQAAIRGASPAKAPTTATARRTAMRRMGTMARRSSNWSAAPMRSRKFPDRAPRYRRQYKIQEVIKRRQVMLVQVVKEERGTKGAALTTYLSLAGRYSVLMPNTARGGGISRKITSGEDRSRLKEIAQELEVPEGMGVILRTAGASRTKTEIKRDFEYLLRLWETVRDLTLKSTAPKLVYEEGSLVKRSIRDLYSKDIDEVIVAGPEAYEEAKEFMRMLMPSHAQAT